MQHRMVFFVAAVAIILAIAGFLLLSFLTRADEPAVEQPGEQTAEQTPGAEQTPDGDGEQAGEQTPGDVPEGEPVQVDGTTVYLQTLPERAVTVAEAPPEEVTAEVTEPEPQPTETLEVIVEPEQQPTAAPPVAGAAGDSVIFIDYVVQPGDTLYSIADKQTTSIELMAVHGISSEDLDPGTTLRLPVGNPAYCSGATTYVVEPGDTVFSIARRFNTTTQAIQSANGLNANFRINVAQVLCIP